MKDILRGAVLYLTIYLAIFLAIFFVHLGIVALWPFLVTGIMVNELYQHYALTRKQQCARRRMNSQPLSTTSSVSSNEEREYLELLSHVATTRKKVPSKQS